MVLIGELRRSVRFALDGCVELGVALIERISSLRLLVVLQWGYASASSHRWSSCRFRPWYPRSGLALLVHLLHLDVGDLLVHYWPAYGILVPELIHEFLQDEPSFAHLLG